VIHVIFKGSGVFVVRRFVGVAAVMGISHCNSRRWGTSSRRRARSKGESSKRKSTGRSAGPGQRYARGLALERPFGNVSLASVHVRFES
jgi:hypothetical protein